MKLRAFQSTLPARGATAAAEKAGVTIEISIHAPRTGSDNSCGDGKGKGRYFNPRSPHGERLDDITMPFGVQDFNPRSPHGERLNQRNTAPDCSNFNPRSPHGERRQSMPIQTALLKFQSTLPARGATGTIQARLNTIEFQSTLPARGATRRQPTSCRRRY